MNIRLKPLIPPFIMLAACFFTGCDTKKPAVPKTLQKITVGSVPAIVEAPTHVAWEMGYFKEQGLDVDLSINPDGKTSLQQLFGGRADIIHVMATPVVYASFDRDDFFVIGKIRHSKIHFAVARKDRGIRKPSDLVGKKVAVTKGTSGEFFMDSYFLHNGIDPSRVDIVYMDGPTMVETILKGDVDAMFCWSPFPLLAEKRLGKNAVVLASENIVPGSWLIVVNEVFAMQHPDILKRYLKALLKAEEYIAGNREKAIFTHAKVAGVDTEIVSKLFENMEWGMGLDQALLSDLEDQARWIIRYGYTKKTKVPNYLELIHAAPLEGVKPEAVTVIK
jgi:ABC-type nitrate/sulfonate/bicarbonate transport system substrate-binding protein